MQIFLQYCYSAILKIKLHYSNIVKKKKKLFHFSPRNFSLLSLIIFVLFSLFLLCFSICSLLSSDPNTILLPTSTSTSHSILTFQNPLLHISLIVMVLSSMGRRSSMGLVATWFGGGVAWCGSLFYGDGSIDGSLRRWFYSLAVMGLLMGLSQWLIGLLMGFRFNGFWDQWLWVPMGFVQQWRSTWVMTRSCMVVGVDRGEIMRGGSNGVLMGIVAVSNGWSIELWLNEHACWVVIVVRIFLYYFLYYFNV